MRWMLVLGAIGFLVAALTAGCTHESAAPATPVEQVQILVHPWHRDVQLVSRAPIGRYQYLGHVRGRAADGASARAALTQKAQALGADVVQVQRVSSARRHVVIAGDAYRLAD